MVTGVFIIGNEINKLCGDLFQSKVKVNTCWEASNVSSLDTPALPAVVAIAPAAAAPPAPAAAVFDLERIS